MPGAAARARVVAAGGPDDVRARLALRIRDDVLAVLDVSPRTRRDLAEEAAFRKRSVGAVVEDILEAVMADETGDTLAGLLDGGGRRR